MTSLLTRILGRLPLGWLQLMHNKTRLISAVCGVAFANILIFMQLGFMGAITETSVLMHRSWDADVILASSDYKSLREANSIPRARLLQALQVEGVSSINPYFIDTIPWTHPVTGNAMNFRIMGVPTEGPVYRDPALQRGIFRLTEPRAALLDLKTRSLPPDVFAALRENNTYEIELAGRSIRFVGGFTQGASFDVDGSIIVSDSTFLDYFSYKSASTPTFGFIKCAPGTDHHAIAKAINQVFPEKDTKAMTIEDFIQAEKDYQQTLTPTGFVFGFGVVIGLIVGLVIVYQILTTDVQDHLAEYATFKAMGYNQKFFLSVIFEQAIALAALGFIPGYLISLSLYALTSKAIALPLHLGVERMGLVFFLIVVMCSISGAIATRRLANAQPAELF